MRLPRFPHTRVEEGEQLLPPRCPECGPLDYDEVIGESGSAWPADHEQLVCNLCGTDVPRRAVCSGCEGTGQVPAVEEQPCGCDLLAADDCELCLGSELRPVEVWELCSDCDGEGATALAEGGR